MIGKRISGTLWLVAWRYSAESPLPGGRRVPMDGRRMLITADPTGADLLEVTRLVVLGAKATPEHGFHLVEVTRHGDIDGLGVVAASEMAEGAVHIVSDPASKAAHAAVTYLLDRIQTDPDLYYYCGVGTQSFHLLTAAEAARTGRPLAEVEAERRKDLQPAHRRREPEVEVLRRKLEEARS